jgi:hypothetical protein
MLLLVPQLRLSLADLGALTLLFPLPLLFLLLRPPHIIAS